MTSTRWNDGSRVTVCPDCQGAGVVWSPRPATIDDPYPEMACDNCDGPNGPECEVCGYTTEVQGYDCFACDTVNNIPEAQLASFDIDELAAAMREALDAATEEQPA